MPADTLRPFVIPVELTSCVQRITLAGGVMVHHVLARQLRGNVGIRPVPTGGPLEQLRLVPAYPFQLRADGLARQQCASPLEDVLLAEFSCERRDFVDSSGVDTVEDGGS